LQAMLDDGHEVLVPAPDYPLWTASTGLAGGTLAIQGPPGSGKTTIGAEIILELVKAGKRVGITANSHKVIGNLLDKLMEVARLRGQPIRAIQKADERDRCASKEVQCSGSSTIVEAALSDGDVDIVAGTTWLFARPTFPPKLEDRPRI